MNITKLKSIISYIISGTLYIRPCLPDGAFLLCTARPAVSSLILVQLAYIHWTT